MTDKQCLFISIVALVSLAIILATFYFFKIRRQENRERKASRKLETIPFSEVQELAPLLSVDSIRQLKKISDSLVGAGFKSLANLLIGEEGEFRMVLGNSDFGIYAEISFDQNSGNFLISLLSYFPDQTLVTSQRDKSFFEGEPFLNFERHSPETQPETIFSTHLHKLIKSMADTAEKKNITKRDYLSRRLRYTTES